MDEPLQSHHIRLSPAAAAVLARVTGAVGVTAAGFIEAVLLRQGSALGSSQQIVGAAREIDQERRARPGPRRRKEP